MDRFVMRTWDTVEIAAELCPILMTTWHDFVTFTRPENTTLICNACGLKVKRAKDQEQWEEMRHEILEEPTWSDLLPSTSQNTTANGSFDVEPTHAKRTPNTRTH